MKKINLIRAMAVLATMTFFTTRAQAQTATFINNKSCPVTVFLEERSQPQCGGACASGPLLLPPGVTHHNLCSGFSDLCIIVTRVGGCAVNTGIHLTRWCHGATPVLNDADVLAAGCCGTATSWHATWNFNTNTFTIN